SNMTTLDGVWTYTYDAAGQLTRAIFTSNNPAIPSQDLDYNYDPNGNLMSTLINGQTTVYTTNSVNEYTSIGGVAQHYDANGNLLDDGSQTYTYDQLNELMSVSNTEGATQYTYNAFGQRIRQSTGSAITQYLFDPAGLGNVVATYDNTGALLAH